MNKELDVRCQKDENENCALDAKSHKNVEFQSIFELIRVIQKWINFIPTFTLKNMYKNLTLHKLAITYGP